MIRMSLKSVLSAVALPAAAVATATLLAAPASAAAVPQGRAVVALHSTGQHHVIAPAALRPGLVHLRNSGIGPIAVFAKKSAGVGTFITEMNDSQGAHASRLFRDFDFVILLMPRSDEYTYLRRGTYYLVDASANRFGPARVRTVEVNGARRDARRPSAGRLTVARGGMLSGTPTGPHHEYVRFANTSDSPRLLFMIGVARSTTPAQLRAFLAHPSYDRMSALSSLLFAFPAFVGAHHTAIVHLIAPDHRYFVIAQGPTNTNLRRGQVRVLTLG